MSLIADDELILYYVCSDDEEDECEKVDVYKGDNIKKWESYYEDDDYAEGEYY